jgi:hypothetical protein
MSNNSKTPETDEIETAYMQQRESVGGIIEHAKELEQQRDELQQWKDSALRVEASWDAQSVGKLLGFALGSAIHTQIEPALRKIIEQRDKLQEELDKANSYIATGRSWNSADSIIAEVTKQRDHYKSACDQYSEDEILCKLQEVTKQRDTLAEALQEIKDICLDKTIELHSDDDCKGMVDDLLEIAAKALAATKGGTQQ